MLELGLLQLIVYSSCECPQVVQPLHYCQQILKWQGDLSQLQRGQPLTGHKGIHQRGKVHWKVV